jgi:hypothetical protein
MKFPPLSSWPGNINRVGPIPSGMHKHLHHIYSMDTATYAAAAALLWGVIQWLERPFVPEVDFLPFNLSEIARLSYRQFYTTGPCNDI